MVHNVSLLPPDEAPGRKTLCTISFLLRLFGLNKPLEPAIFVSYFFLNFGSPPAKYAIKFIFGKDTEWAMGSGGLWKTLGPS